MKWQNRLICVRSYLAFSFSFAACSSFPKLPSVDVRLTHNHVTNSDSILRPIILLLLNYIARIQLKNIKKKTFQTFFFGFAIIYNCRHFVQSRVCVLVASNIIFVRCANEKSVALASNEYCFSANSQNVEQSVDECARCCQRAWNFFRKKDRPPSIYRAFVNSFCVCASSHSSHIWPWREHYLSHISLVWLTTTTTTILSERLFIIFIFFFFFIVRLEISSDYGIISNDFDTFFFNDFDERPPDEHLTSSHDIIIHYKVHDSYNDVIINSADDLLLLLWCNDTSSRRCFLILPCGKLRMEHETQSRDRTKKKRS